VIRPVATVIALLWTAPVTTEAVELASHRRIDLAPFACTDTPRSTVIRRVCYDTATRHLLVNAMGDYSQYCEFPAATFDAFVSAPSMGLFYRRNIAGAAPRFACAGVGTN
jgi:hypothetical protein